MPGILARKRVVRRTAWLFSAYFLPLVGLVECGSICAQQGARAVVPAPGEAAPRRIALVIGNADYPGQPLRNPVNDANDIGVLLSNTLGFETETVRNADLQAFDSAVDRFVGKLSAGDVGLFYFSGHGLEVDGENYLLPVSFAATSRAEVKYQSYPADEILDLMRERGVRLSILILDACRNNPYRSWKGVGGGLASMTAKGAFIAFAAAAGETADDNPSERNGLFTKYLLRVLPQPGLSIGDVFDEVREGVFKASHGKQTPFSYSGIIGNFSFRLSAKPPLVSGAAPLSNLTAEPAQEGTPSRVCIYNLDCPSQAQADEIQFITLHSGRNPFSGAESHPHAGVLSVSAGHVAWAEYGPHAHPQDNFSVACSEIVAVGHVNGFFVGGGAIEIRTRYRKYVLELSPAGVLQVISKACPDVAIK